MAKYGYWSILFLIFGISVFTSCKKSDNNIVASDDPASSDNNMQPTFIIQFPPEPVTTQIPLEYDGLMSVIECQLNGIACKMMLDTGSETVCLFEDKLEKFSLKTVGESQSGYTAGGVVKHSAIEEFTIEFPDAIKVVANNCSALPQFPDKPDIDGIIGGPVFVTLKATIDYDCKMLTLKAHGAIQSADNDE